MWYLPRPKAWEIKTDNKIFILLIMIVTIERYDRNSLSIIHVCIIKFRERKRMYCFILRNKVVLTRGRHGTGTLSRMPIAGFNSKSPRMSGVGSSRFSKKELFSSSFYLIITKVTYNSYIGIFMNHNIHIFINIKYIFTWGYFFWISLRAPGS